MEEAHRIHKDAHVWGWLATLADWRRSRARRHLRAGRAVPVDRRPARPV